MKKRVPILLPSVLVLMIQLLLPTCQKYRAKENDVAKYELVSSAGICSGTIVSGNYYAGVALAADNTISVQVNVTKVGKYTITTSNVNGVQFSANGEFSSTGIKTVQLQGTGSPALSGGYIYNTNGTSGCEFVLLVREKSVDYAVYTVYETGLVCQEPVANGRFINGVPLSGDSRIVFSIHVTAPGAFAIFTNNVNGIYFTASGTFTTTGDQTVILHGFGTPADAGNFYFNLYAGNGSCSFRVSCTNS